MDSTLALAFLADSGGLGTVLTVGTSLLVALLAAGSAAGGFAAFKTGRTNAIAASAVARAAEAEATAETWKGRLEAVQAEFAATQEHAEHQATQDRENLAVAQHEITRLKEQVATLEGVVTARHEITQLTDIVTTLGQTVSSMLATLRDDHAAQHQAHDQILAALGGHASGH